MQVKLFLLSPKPIFTCHMHVGVKGGGGGGLDEGGCIIRDGGYIGPIPIM